MISQQVVLLEGIAAYLDEYAMNELRQWPRASALRSQAEAETLIYG